MKGFHNKILIVDLASGKTSHQETGEDVCTKYLGGKGIATRLLLDMNPPRVDPLSPGNRLIFAQGPLADAKVHGSARYGVFTRSPLTGFYLESYAGGASPDYISRTGHDAVVLEGASDKPVWIEVTDEKVEFHDADDLWGLDAHQADRAVRKKLPPKRAGVLVIGPAGESGVRFAGINNDLWHKAGRGGAGAVMGSKKIKAIAFHGGKKRRPADPGLLDRHWKRMMERAKTDPGVASYKKYGTMQMVAIANEAGVFPARYWELGRREDYLDKISGQALLKRCKVGPSACPRCFIACGNRAEVLAGRHKGLVIEGPEYETVYAFGGLCMIEEIEEIMYLNDICDREGLDTITMGNLAAFAMHAYEHGASSHEIVYGDVDATAELIRMTSRKEGIGAVLAEGIIRAARHFGIEDHAVHVKGMEPAGYDPRPLKGMALSYAVSDRGACHLRTTFYKAEFAGLIEPDAVEGKAEALLDYEDRLTLHDCLVMCRFFRDMTGWDELSLLVKGATGMDLDREGLKRIAADVTDLTREFNLRQGLRPEHDSLPDRLIDRRLEPSGESVTREQMDRLVSDYYRARGWNDAGKPAK